MKKIKSIAVVILVIAATVFGLTSCHHNRKCKNGDAKCEKASCCKDASCCDKCSDKCTPDNKCCDKCKVGEKKSCCMKDSMPMKGMGDNNAMGMYACPMHKDITSNKPGKCSKCGMQLEKKE